MKLTDEERLIIERALRAYRAPYRSGDLGGYEKYREQAIADDLHNRVRIAASIELVRITEHQITRQSDEYACSCGRRWDVSEGDEHPV